MYWLYRNSGILNLMQTEVIVQACTGTDYITLLTYLLHGAESFLSS